MGGYRPPGPTCQVKNWFSDSIDPGTSPLIAMPVPKVPDETDRLMAGLNVHFWLPPLGFSPLGHQGSAEFADFEQRVLNAQIVQAELKKHRSALPPIPDDELETVEGKYKLRAAAAAKCKRLLESARNDLRAAKASGDREAAKVSGFGLTSAYRSPEYDEGIWHSGFRSKYYQINARKFSKKGRFVVGNRVDAEIEKAVIRELVDFIHNRKAAPGFSNHSGGIAVDFFTTEGGVMHQANTGTDDAALHRLNQAWEGTWFYKWIDSHKRTYGVKRIPTEAWHWEFH